MRCPHCGKLDDKVIESRTLGDGGTIRRRRECLSCGFRFTSYENIEEKKFMVVKRDGRRQPFEREKLSKGVQRALEKRPVSSQSAENLISEIYDEAVMENRQSMEISTERLGGIVLEKLYKIDTVAYIRFASVYRRFENLDEFVKVVREIKKMEKKRGE